MLQHLCQLALGWLDNNKSNNRTERATYNSSATKRYLYTQALT